MNFILEGQVEDKNLSNAECKILSKLVQIYYDMREIESKELFFLGGKEVYFFFKNLGLIKE